MKSLVPLILFLVVSLIFWIVIYRHLKSLNKKIPEYFKQIAEKYGLALDLHAQAGESNKVGNIVFPTAKGLYKNRQLTIGCSIKGGNKKTPQTYIKVECSNRHNLNFHIEKSGKNHKYLNNSSRVSLMDSEFDDKFIVLSNSPPLIISTFTFNVKYSLLQALHLDFKGELKLENNILNYTEPVLMKNESSKTRIELLLHIMCDIADELEKV
jgi:hypothetical protein